MAKTMYHLDCIPDCGFMMESDDKAEVMNLSKMHAGDKHDMDMTDEETEAMITVVKA